MTLYPGGINNGPNPAHRHHNGCRSAALARKFLFAHGSSNQTNLERSRHHRFDSMATQYLWSHQRTPWYPRRAQVTLRL